MRPSNDYSTYREIIEDLLKPIVAEGLDYETLQRLYESKLVYLENLRVKCFRDINVPKKHGSVVEGFESKDYQLILKAISQTKISLKHEMMNSIQSRLSKIAV